MNFDTVGGRRFLLTCASGTVASAMQWFGKLDLSGTAWAAVVIGTVAAYITGNTVQKKNEANK